MACKARGLLLLWWTLGPPVRELPGLTQPTVPRGFAGQIDRLIGQARHHLARRQILVLIAIEHRQPGLPRRLAELVEPDVQRAACRRFAYHSTCRVTDFMHFAFTDEQKQCRVSVQRFLRERSPITAVRGASAKRRIFNLDVEVDSVDASDTRL